MNHATELTTEQIRKYAPSAFAEQPYEKQSSRYTFIPTIDVIQGMVGSGFVPVAASQSRTRIAGKQFFTKHMLRFRPFESLNMTAVVGETVPEAVLINSHDGTSAYKLFFGVYRFVCTNGMMVADSMFESIRIRHMGNVVEEAIEGARRIFENSEKVMEGIRNWQAIDLKSTEQLALAESAHILRFGEQNTDVTPQMLLNPRRYNDQGSDLWHVFNRIQENTIKGISANSVRRQSADPDVRIRRVRTNRAVKGIDQDVKLNRALWTLAEKMAELKN